jgi:hypothetical protein
MTEYFLSKIRLLLRNVRLLRVIWPSYANRQVLHCFHNATVTYEPMFVLYLKFLNARGLQDRYLREGYAGRSCAKNVTVCGEEECERHE